MVTTMLKMPRRLKMRTLKIRMLKMLMMLRMLKMLRMLTMLKKRMGFLLQRKKWRKSQKK
jgi:hypothetical protein